MASNCYACGEPAEGECLVCGKAFCRLHGDRLCTQCSEQDEIERRAEAYEGLPSPLFFRGALAIAILAVILEIGWDAYRSVSGSPAQYYAVPTTIGVVQNPTPQSLPTPQTQPTPQSTPQPTPVPPKQTPEPPAATAAAVVRYTVQSGDTLETIASKFGVTWQAVQAANNVDPSRLQIGQSLVIPSKQ